MSRHIFVISLNREKEFRQYWPKLFESEEDKATDEWWMRKLLIDIFNAVCKNIIASSLKVGDESMSAISFWTTVKGDLPHLSYILRELEPLGV